MTAETSQVSLPKLLPLCLMVFAAFITVDRAVSAGLKRVLSASHDRYLRVYQPGPAATSVVGGIPGLVRTSLTAATMSHRSSSTWAKAAWGCP